MYNSTPPSSRTALRTLIIVFLTLVGVLIYAYGWKTTDISLEEVQAPIRKASLKRALTELLSPNIFTRARKEESLLTSFWVGCPQDGQTGESPVSTSGQPYVVFTPPCADPDEVVTVEGFHFHPDGVAALQFVRDVGQQKLPFQVVKGPDTEITTGKTSFDIDEDGHFKVYLQVPRGRGLQGSNQKVEVLTGWYYGWPHLSKTTRTVIEKMIETIFLALMATTLAVPISVALSFLSARNLMRQVYLPSGVVLIGFILLPVGGWLGYYLLKPLGNLGLDWGKDLYLGVIGPIVAIAGFVLVTRGMTLATHAILRVSSPRSIVLKILPHIRRIILNALLLAVVIFIVGALGGIGIRLGEELARVGSVKVWLHIGNTALARGTVDPAGVLSQFIGTLGQLVDLTIALLAAAGGAIFTGSVGAELAVGPMRSLRNSTINHLLGAVLGLLGGGILLVGTAFIGMQATLLSLLTPLIAAILGGQVAVSFRRLFKVSKPKRDETATDQAVRTVLLFIGAVITFIVVAYVLNLVRSVIDGRSPSAAVWKIADFSIRLYFIKAAIIGAVLGGWAGGLSGIHTPFPLGMAVYNTARTTLNALRSIEPLIMAIVFVIWVGIGPFAGVLALTLHSIASLGKLYSEQVESIDAGPIEAILATGANRLQMIVYAVVPQIVPPYIAFTMYRWDINVRMSTIIGFVGGGGIGFLLQQQINLLNYNQAGVAVLAIAIVVSALDYASASIRERII